MGFCSAICSLADAAGEHADAARSAAAIFAPKLTEEAGGSAKKKPRLAVRHEAERFISIGEASRGNRRPFNRTTFH
jgi:hypothetical protein